MTSPAVATPKQKGQPEWYRYYAGYSERFVRDAIGVLAGKESADRAILDPWNGSGTTTSVARRLGLIATGVDLNPVLSLIAAARVAPVDGPRSLSALGKDLLSHARREATAVPAGTLLITRLFDQATCIRVWSLIAAIQRVLADETFSGANRIAPAAPEPLPAFFTVAAFDALRELCGSFRTSNPTWTKVPQRPLSISRAELDSAFASAVDRLRARLVAAPASGSTTIVTGSAENLPLATASMDLVVTSPPYATRIDYGVATLVELAALGWSIEEFKTLRLALLGSPLTDGSGATFSSEWSEAAHLFLTQVRSHRSRASKSYYAHFYERYFAGLKRSMTELGRVAKSSASMAMVVQDSNYKEHRLNLPTVVSELLSADSWREVHRWEFTGPTMAALNPATRTRRADGYSGTESVLVFRRGHDEES
jgi:hypothetical protein